MFTTKTYVNQGIMHVHIYVFSDNTTTLWSVVVTRSSDSPFEHDDAMTIPGAWTHEGKLEHADYNSLLNWMNGREVGHLYNKAAMQISQYVSMI